MSAKKSTFIAVPTNQLIAALKWDTFSTFKTRGIYMLMKGGEVNYIGQSNDVQYRVACHAKEGKIPFDWVQFAETRKRDLDAIEKFLIEFHEPPFNTTHTYRAHKQRGPKICRINKSQPQNDRLKDAW